MGGTAEAITSSEAGLDRRALIRRAAIVGAAAWATPAIVGSVASPAGAVTAACSFAQWDLLSNCTFQKTTNAQDCVPPVQANCTTTALGPTGFCTAQGGIVISCPTSTSLRLTIPAGCSCVFVAGVAKGTGTGGCATGIITNGKQMDFTWATSGAARVSFYISC